MIPSPSSSNEPPPQSNPVLTAYEEWAAKTPAITKFLLILLTISYAISWFFDPFFALACIPFFVVWRKYELYRLVLSPLVNRSLFSVLFAFLSFQRTGKLLEQSSGSTNFAWLCAVMCVTTNLLFISYTVLLVILSGGDVSHLFSGAAGLWCILFGCIALECCRAPRDTRRRLFFWDVPVLYYPLALLGLFSLLDLNIDAAHAASVMIGYGMGLGQLEFLFLSPSTVKRWEETHLASLTRREGWIAGHAALGSGAWSEDASGGSGSVRREKFVLRCD
jgi:membrane associated rhomboid family serine protease